jgi:Flp pilus assembly secretin CpaC
MRFRPLGGGVLVLVMASVAAAEDLGEVCPCSTCEVAKQVDPAVHQLLKQKLAERDRLELEIDALQAEARTSEQIVVKLRMMEVNLTRVRKLGIDYTTTLQDHNQGANVILDNIGPSTGVYRSADEKFQTAIADGSIGGFLDALDEKGCARSLAEPTLVVLSGKAASFHVGGEFPTPRADRSGIEFHKYGTQLDLTAHSLGNDQIRIEARPRVTKLESNHAIKVGDVDVPGLSVCEIDTAVQLKTGQTWVMSGLVQERAESIQTDTGIKDTRVQIALVVLLTPEIVH